VRLPDVENVLREETALAFPDVLVFAAQPDSRMGETPSITFTRTGGAIQYPAREEALIAIDARAKLTSTARDTLADVITWLYERLQAGTVGELILHELDTNSVAYTNPDPDRPDLQRQTANLRIVYRTINH